VYFVRYKNTSLKWKFKEQKEESDVLKANKIESRFLSEKTDWYLITKQDRLFAKHLLLAESCYAQQMTQRSCIIDDRDENTEAYCERTLLDVVWKTLQKYGFPLGASRIS